MSNKLVTLSEEPQQEDPRGPRPYHRATDAARHDEQSRINKALLKQTWQAKVLRSSQGQLRAILLAVLWPELPVRPPKFVGKATITSDGFVMCNFIDRDGNDHLSALVCDVEDLTRNFRGIADHCKLDDIERKALFEELRRWIARDYRARSTLD